MENVKNSALKIAFGNIEKATFYIPIYDNTQFILQSLIFLNNGIRIFTNRIVFQYFCYLATCFTEFCFEF